MLNLNLSSFSYRHGYPSVSDEHGGGFVFDCRAISNPGREQRYKDKSGLDPEVIAYLDNLPETAAFYSAVKTLVLASVLKYQARGFTTLHVAFGCTGGQHRSVYFAQRLAADLRAEPQVQVFLQHRESASWGKK